jgi:hypothetical protein
MSEERLVKVAFQGGRYEAELHAPEETGIEAVHEGRVIAAGRLVPGEGATRVSVEFPAEVLSDGVQVVSLRSTLTGAVLDRVTFLAGDALDEDIRAEVALLRDELEMLKRAFRRHVSGQVG